MFSTFSKRTNFLPTEITWENWGSVFLKVDLWRPVVTRICEATAVASAQCIEAGFPGSCAVFVVDKQVIVKLYPPLLARDFYRERAAYRLLTGRLPHLPRLLGEGFYPDQIDWPYLLLEFCEGIAIRDLFMELKSDNRLLIARELAAMLRVVHDTAVTNLHAFNSEPKTWADFVNHRRTHVIAELRQKNFLSEAILVELASFIEKSAVGSEQPVLLNADLTEDHLLLVQRDNQWLISALIDWADVEVGAVEYEWIPLWFGLCQRDGAMFRELMGAYDPNWQLNEVFLDRVMAYTVLHRFGPAIMKHVWVIDGRPLIANLNHLRQQLWGNLLS